MPGSVRVNGVAKYITDGWVNVGDAAKEIIGGWINVSGVAKRIYTNFQPQDITFATPGTYTLNIGGATHVHVSGRGADGAGGGGGGAKGGNFFGQASQYQSDSFSNRGGEGNPGPDGADGERHIGFATSNGLLLVRGRGSAGGGGEAGQNGGDTEVRYGSTDLVVILGGRGGAGGRGAHDFSGTNAFGGTGGVNTTGSILSQTGGAGGSLGGRQGWAGETLSETTYEVAENTTLTIIVGAAGLLGNPGRGGQKFQGRAADGNPGEDGPNDGWVRIRTARE